MNRWDNKLAYTPPKAYTCVSIVIYGVLTGDVDVDRAADS